ncbi:hypothetical protein CUMW_185230 [Citrus unshiu]|nr:hypothetical protein CUMW_185230 [Citrus unshiu]
MKVVFALLLLLLSLEAFVQCEMRMEYDLLGKFIKAQQEGRYVEYSGAPKEAGEELTVYIGPQEGLKEADKIEKLPGQPYGVEIDQYSGYVTVDPKAGRALFYYFVESQNSSTKPLVLWLNGGPGCSSFGFGAMMELGPFRVNSDGKSLSHNEYAWNNGVGFSYSNGDERTAADSYTFLLNWFERFPEYKSREFFLAGESYAGHYIPQLALKILQFNKNQTFINLKGLAMGNAWIDTETGNKGMFDFYWTHAPFRMKSSMG